MTGEHDMLVPLFSQVKIQNRIHLCMVHHMYYSWFCLSVAARIPLRWYSDFFKGWCGNNCIFFEMYLDSYKMSNHYSLDKFNMSTCIQNWQISIGTKSFFFKFSGLDINKFLFWATYLLITLYIWCPVSKQRHYSRHCVYLQNH